jgi:hypothetical protein
MHPLRCLEPLPLLASQVTNRGNSSACSKLLRLLLVSLPARPSKPLRSDESEVLDDAFVFSDGVLELADGADDDELVDGVCAISRFMAGKRLVPELASSSVDEASSSSEDDVYLAQSSSMEARLSGFRFSKLADRLSKQ